MYMKAGDNHMKINIGNHEFTELWDGFLPVKVKDEVKLADYVYMIIIPSEYRKQIMEVMPEQLSDRAFFRKTVSGGRKGQQKKYMQSIQNDACQHRTYYFR